MAIRIKRTKRRIKIQGLAILVFSFVLMLYFFTSIALRSINVSLSVQLQNKSAQLAQIQSQNKNLAKEIQRLSDYERVMAIAKEAGLSLNGNNVIEFSTGE
jgi:cell division protein FtsL